ncbi:hypothetical protein T07_7324 [Trichinella nelsoni]|uniref:Uncharacterized protein n=1 Tax=Trichinella nelsoni TaxID=6336 RepID=A0A0V0REA7_9BILA|nr:hypothetical protein T07_7324 [Trichinella nelsoni]
MVGKGYEVSVFDVAPNVPDKQVEREKLPVECAAFPFGICELPTEQGKQLPVVVDQLFQHSTDGGTGCIHCNCCHRRKLKLFLPRLALWDCRPMDCIEIAFLGGGGHIAMVKVGHSDEL